MALGGGFFGTLGSGQKSAVAVVGGAALLILCVAIVLVATEEEPQRAANGKRLFIPSYQWQTVADDEMVPPGLEIRMNFETGKNEARIPPPSAEQ